MLYTHRDIKDGEPRTATSTFTQSLSSYNDYFVFKRCFTSALETILKTVRDGESSRDTSTFTAPGLWSAWQYKV